MLLAFLISSSVKEKLLAYRGFESWPKGGPVQSESLLFDDGVFKGTALYPISLQPVDANFIVDESAIVGASNPLSNVIPTRDGLRKYKIRKGDTLSSIAAQFGLNLETVRAANPAIKSSLQPGQELVILPTPGVLYSVKPDDSLESVASRFGINEELIAKYNPDYQRIFDGLGGSIVLPYVIRY